MRLLLLMVLVSTTATAQVPSLGYRVVATYDHDINAFTQGLAYEDGFLYEGTGKHGLSTLSKIDFDSGEVVNSVKLGDRYFGEGIEIVGDRIYQLTWQSHMVFVYDKESFEQITSHYNATEGWGLAWNGSELILSDGSNSLQFIDPESFTPLRKVQVTLEGNPVTNLNELEYIDGEIWANVWQTDYIVRIDPSSGVINSVVNLQGLSELTSLGSSEAVLNGIAWDAANRRLFVTGKHWSNLFEIEVLEQ